MSKLDNTIIQVRAQLQAKSIKLWLEPYYYEEIGSNPSEIQRLAEELSKNLGITLSLCTLALEDLQERALLKLAARKEFDKTGMASFNVRYVKSQGGTQKIIDVKCALTALGSELQKIIAENLEINDSKRIKIIAAGKIVDPSKTLLIQDLKNSQPLMVILSNADANTMNSEEAMYDRIQKIKNDVEAIVDSKRQYFEMEDQDGNPVFLPPEESRAIMMALGFYEIARTSIKREHYDEALILLLEADEKFSSCNSRFLDAVDNYALVNLDIVWCYLCLKNVTQLPDAERRLQICEKTFLRSYGQNLDRARALTGEAVHQRSLFARLHLLQGIVLFHQNRRDEAYEKFETAASELKELKVNDSSLETIVEMGYEPFEARMGLRTSGGNIEQAINFIIERKNKVRIARKQSRKERDIDVNLSGVDKDTDWVNPKSVSTLIDMGFESALVVEALRKSSNDVTKALDMLQMNSDELRQNMQPVQHVDESIMTQLKEIGFDEAQIRIALETTRNNLEKSIDFLIKFLGNEDELQKTIDNIAAGTQGNLMGPSTSSGAASLLNRVKEKVQIELETMKAYERVHKGISGMDDEYMDLPLLKEEQLLVEYQRFLT